MRMLANQQAAGLAWQQCAAAMDGTKEFIAQPLTKHQQAHA